MQPHLSTTGWLAVHSCELLFPDPLPMNPRRACLRRETSWWLRERGCLLPPLVLVSAAVSRSPTPARLLGSDEEPLLTLGSDDTGRGLRMVERAVAPLHDRSIPFAEVSFALL